MNKSHKGEGALPGIMTNPEAILRYCLSAPELSRLSAGVKKMLQTSEAKIEKTHHRDNSGKLFFQERAVAKLREVLERCNPFTGSTSGGDNTENKLFNITSKVIMPTDV